MPVQFVSTLGERIRKARRAAALTQEQVSEALKVTRAAVATWETDKSAPSQAKWTALAQVLGVSLPWLAVGDGPMKPSERPETNGSATHYVGPLLEAISAAAKVGEYDVAAHAAEVLARRFRRMGRGRPPLDNGPASVTMLHPAAASHE